MGDYYKTKESAEEYRRAAEGYNGKELIDLLKPILPEKSTLLEIGSGPGSDWELLNETYEVVGSDNSDQFLHRLKAKFLEGKFLNLDAVTLDTNMKFDGIYSNKVLHHLTGEELIKSVRRQFELINPNGLVCHSFWKGEGAEVFKGLFVNYHTEKDLMAFFSDYFEVLTLKAYEEFEAGDSLLFIGRKKYSE